MSGRSIKTRTQPCSGSEAAKRLADAESFMQLAELADGQAPRRRTLRFAAADSACCRRLGERSRGQDHRDAIKLVEQVQPGGKDAGNALSRLLAIKNDAEYGLKPLSGKDRETAVEKPRTAARTEIDVSSPEEIAALVRAADSVPLTGDDAPLGS
jgi:hypothetical protein